MILTIILLWILAIILTIAFLKGASPKDVDLYYKKGNIEIIHRGKNIKFTPKNKL